MPKYGLVLGKHGQVKGGQEMSRGGGDSSWGSYRVKLRFCRVNLSVNLWSRSGGKTSMMGSAEVCSVV